MFRVETDARINFEFRTIYIKAQKIFLNDQLIWDIPSRNLNYLQEFTADQLVLINEDNLNSIMSQKLLYDLSRDSTIRGLYK